MESSASTLAHDMGRTAAVNHDDDLGPVGGVGDHGRSYGGRQRTANNHVTPPPDEQISAVFDKVRDNTPNIESRTTIDIARRLRRWLAEEEIHISLDEARRFIEQHGQS